jgi:hypothetical protein
MDSNQQQRKEIAKDPKIMSQKRLYKEAKKILCEQKLNIKPNIEEFKFESKTKLSLKR